MVLHATTPKPFHCVLAAEPRVFETVSFCSLQEPFVQTPTTLRTFHLSVLPPSFDLAIELTENQCRSVCVCVFLFFFGGYTIYHDIPAVTKGCLLEVRGVHSLDGTKRHPFVTPGAQIWSLHGGDTHFFWDS